jgi:GNAT superfamily N-acetyltransferase
MIYQATIEDIPKIIPCAVEYTDQIPGMEFDAKHYVDFWRNMLTTGTGVIFLSETDGVINGGIGGVKFPEALSGRLTAVEMFWYTAKETRGDGIKLYLKFKKWAKEAGCRRLAMIYLPCSMPEKLKTFYEKEGFSLIEMHYEMALAKS